jgi:hypothetical protein
MAMPTLALKTNATEAVAVVSMSPAARIAPVLRLNGKRRGLVLITNVRTAGAELRRLPGLIALRSNPLMEIRNVLKLSAMVCQAVAASQKLPVRLATMEIRKVVLAKLVNVAGLERIHTRLRVKP